MESIEAKPYLPLRYGLLLTVIGGILIGQGVIFVLFFENLPSESTSLAIDWAGLWHDIRAGIRYQGTLRNPPWSVLILWPVTQLPMKQAWGLTMYATLIVEVLSVPSIRPKWHTVLGALLLVVSLPSLRNMADGNLEGLVIAGLLLISAGLNRKHPLALAAGIILASAKPQSVVLLFPVLALVMIKKMPRRELVQTVVLVLMVMLPTLVWRGAEWWREGVLGNIHAGSIVDMSLHATLSRLGVGDMITGVAIVAVVIVAMSVSWVTKSDLSREKMGMLVAASLLVAPYAAGNSVLSVVAIGLVPLFQRHLLTGLALFIVVNAAWWPHIVAINAEWWLHVKPQVAMVSNYPTLSLGILFVALAWQTLRKSQAPYNA